MEFFVKEKKKEEIGFQKTYQQLQSWLKTPCLIDTKWGIPAKNSEQGFLLQPNTLACLVILVSVLCKHFIERKGNCICPECDRVKAFP